MRKNILLLLLLAGICKNALAQLPQFNLQVDEKKHQFGTASGFTQDQQGYIWFGSFTKGLIKFDGKTFTNFRHEPENSNSPASNFIISMATDSSGKIWIGYLGSGLDRFDPVSNTFTHFKNKADDKGSLISDTVINIMIDHTGRPWFGTAVGLQYFDAKTGKFIHISKKIDDKPVSVTPAVFAVYEDKKGMIWFSTGKLETWSAGEFDGLFSLDPATGKQTFYKVNPQNPESLVNPFILAIFEDSRGNFWVGSNGNGLHTLDRKTGKFTRHLYDPLHPGKLARPPISKTDTTDGISFINEDRKGKLWIGSFENGINSYDPKTQELHHYGLVNDFKNNEAFAKDTISGFKDGGANRFMIARDGTTWITGNSGNIYTISYGKKVIPYFPYSKFITSFHLEPNGNILWFGTDSGLVRKDLSANSYKIFKSNPNNPNSLNNNEVVAIKADENGKLYIGTHSGGLDLFDPQTEKFTHCKPDNASPGSTMDSMHAIFIENIRYLWLGGENGLARVDRTTNKFSIYRFIKNNEKGIVGNTVYSIARDKKNNLWFANFGGLDKFVKDSNSFKHYLKGYVVRAVFNDNKGMLWAGTDVGLFHYNETKDSFIQFSSPVFATDIASILNIIEDDKHTLWITTSNSILKISANREQVQVFNAEYGILSTNWNWLNNYKSADGRIFIGGSKGYYMVKPEELQASNPAPVLNFSQLMVGGKEILPYKDGILSAPIWKTEIMNLAYNQNSFSLNFIALNYSSSEAINYSYQLENFDNDWIILGTDHKASFYNIPPGKYKLKVRAINSEGTISEKNLLIIISPPWWKTWWAYCLYAIFIGGIIWTYIRYRSKTLRRENLVLEQKVEHRTKQLQETIESLKSTQSQLIQSEKMASLGELTAGIAHEIQNPLNFVNNFSEVNKELIDEMQTELKAGKIDDAIEISNDIKANEEKIGHHGKRADGIVKGMLHHSRASTGQKELTDINVLCDEYLRLAYHGLRARDKTFNAEFKTEFDTTLSKINIVPQEMGRVILNLINNAFYAVNEKKKSGIENYEPLVSISTKKVNDKPDSYRVEISVRDNGNGIPKNIVDKIFQPFFTTKPTGSGTGLGLSLSYDIVKAHSGELKVISLEGEGSEFHITLPQNKSIS